MRWVHKGPRPIRWLTILVTAAVLTAAAAAGAQTAAPSSKRDQAKALFLEGRRLWGAGEHDAACAQFEHAAALYPSAGATGSLALCDVRLGRHASAYRNYQRAKQIALANGNPEAAAFFAQEASKLEPKIARLRLVGAGKTPGLRVTHNGEPVVPAALGEPLVVPPGEPQRLDAEAAGHQPWSASPSCGAGDTCDVPIPALTPLAPAPGPRAAPETPLPTGEGDSTKRQALIISGFVTLGVALGTSIASFVFMAQAAGAKSDFDQTPTTDLADEAESKALLADVFAGVTGGIGIGGGVLLGGDLPPT